MNIKLSLFELNNGPTSWFLSPGIILEFEKKTQSDFVYMLHLPQMENVNHKHAQFWGMAHYDNLHGNIFAIPTSETSKLSVTF